LVYMLLVVAIVILGAAVLLGIGVPRGRAATGGRHFEPANGLIHGLVEPVATLPPVLLPEQPSPEDIENVGFSLGLRGYRCDQVDEVLDVLSAEINRLHEVIAAHGKEPVISNTRHFSE
jgi:DivIVA domain-containing protein